MENKRKEELLILKGFCKAYAPEINLIESDTCYYDKENKIIGFCFDEIDSCFDRHIIYEHNFPYIKNINPNLFSLLHEIGHYYTMDTCASTEEEDELKAIFSIISYEEVRDDYNTLRQYFNLEEEWVATEWAINFCKENPLLIQVLTDTLNKASSYIYLRNKINI